MKYAVPCGTHDFQCVAHDAVRGLELGREQAHVGPLDEPGVARRTAAPAGSMSGSPLASRGPSAKMAMPRASWACCTASSATCTRPSAAGQLLGRAHVVEPAALARVEARARVLREGAGRVAVAHARSPDLALGGDDGQVGLRGRQGHLAARLLGRDLRDRHLVGGLVLRAPSARRRGTGTTAVALKEYCVRGWVMLPSNPRAASRIVVPTSP